ncbi:hypothetical protein FPV32_11650 [Bacillus tequilensis]|nr:hypothetical protein [Bacillus tequilensis]
MATSTFLNHFKSLFIFTCSLSCLPIPSFKKKSRHHTTNKYTGQAGIFMFCTIPFVLHPFQTKHWTKEPFVSFHIFSRKIKKEFLLSCVQGKKEIDTEYKNNIN